MSYKSEQDDFFQALQDLDDATAKRDSRRYHMKLQTLAKGLQLSLESMRMFERRGIAVEPADMLAVWKRCIPDVWDVPESKALIDLLIPRP